MYLVDYHTHPFGHGNNDYSITLLKEFIKKAEKSGLKEIGFSDHNFFLDKINWDNMVFLKNNYNFNIKLGLEIDYIPGKEKVIKNMINKLPLDYCIGSVHKLGDWMIDHPDYKNKYYKKKIDDIYIEYFDTLKQAVESKLFDIVGHLDLKKIFNFNPKKIELMEIVTPVLKSIKKEGLCMEINTNGLNKPVQEIYPSKKIIKKAYDLNIPITLGSDAHQVERVGEGLPEIIDLLQEIGYKKLVTFNKHQKKLKLI